MQINETVVQTRLPDALAQKLKLYAIQHNIKLKDSITEILTKFIASEPWKNGTWIKQPKTTPDFKPMTVKIPVSVGSNLVSTADKLEVSTSSLAYTAIDWFLSK